ncbi:MAG: 16S rRNA (cytidine(1402)-2'-O)-methyltransferase [Candidatus Puniceispirillum sp.]|nr:16S rRNA (cytidine(1402)-2'-O)-methyltransferase [Candidatus Pelagibacter sp.]MBA4283387.1 16S rRNA (cytidine(1402)-2'-O)-methyltransferase [Candidatus Puniceispirillum sp.]
MKSQLLRSGLYCIATPIGNLKDITIRALETLQSVDYVVCEDTRVTAKLMNHYGIKKRLVVYNDHSSEVDRQKIINDIKAGSSIGLVSDAGTPLINDPGVKLLRECHKHNCYITTLPGASAVTSGLILSGLASHQFSFLGFFDPKAYEEIRYRPGTLIFFESPHRLIQTLEFFKKIEENRSISVVREISKMYEEIQSGNAETLLSHYTKKPPKGEIVIVLGDLPHTKLSDKNIRNIIDTCLQSMSAKETTEYIKLMHKDLPKKKIYNMVLDALDKHVVE